MYLPECKLTNKHCTTKRLVDVHQKRVEHGIEEHASPLLVGCQQQTLGFTAAAIAHCPSRCAASAAHSALCPPSFQCRTCGSDNYECMRGTHRQTWLWNGNASTCQACKQPCESAMQVPLAGCTAITQLAACKPPAPGTRASSRLPPGTAEEQGLTYCQPGLSVCTSPEQVCSARPQCSKAPLKKC